MFDTFFNQTIGFNNLEIICINNCSRDNSRSVLENFVKKYDNVFIHDTKKRISNNQLFNLGLNLSKSEYVLFFNEECSYLDYAFETLYEIISKNNVDMACGNKIFIENGVFYPIKLENLSFKNGFLEMKSVFEEPKIFKYFVNIETMIFNKDFLVNNSLNFEENINSNKIFVYKSFFKANGIILIKKPLVSEKINNNLDKNLNKNSFIKYIKSCENFIIFLKKNYPDYVFLSKDMIIYLLNQLNNKNFSDLDKYELLVLLNRMLQKIGDTELKLTKENQQIYNLILNEKYVQLIKIINLKNSTDNISLNKIKSKNLLFLFHGFDYNVGGLAKAVFNRANLLAEKGFNVSLLNVDPFTFNFIGEKFKNINLIEQNFRNLNYISDKVNFINIFEYYRKKNTKYENKNSNISDFSADLIITEDYVIQKIYKENGITIYDYFLKSRFDDVQLETIKELYKTPYSDKIKNSKITTMFKKNIFKSEFYINDALYLEVKRDNNNHIIEEYFYTEDGFIFFKILKNTNGFNYILLDRFSTSKIVFEEISGFWDYFIEEFCLNLDEKPFLINDCSGPIPSFKNISSDLVYKIGNVHSNPYLEPTYGYGCPMRDISVLKNVEDLDYLVSLTPSEKDDFEKEFKINNICAIPNIINLDDIVLLDKKVFQKDLKKISIFARVSKEKNLEDAIKAFKIVLNKHPDAYLNVYGRVLTPGEKQEYSNISKLITELKLENNIFFKGHVENSYEEMRTSLATLLVSHFEGMPMVILESMANKTPLICYDINFGPRDLILNNKDGFVVEKYNINKLAEKIIYFLDNPDIAIEMGEKAQKNIFKNFKPETIYNQWINVLKQAYINSKIRKFLKLETNNDNEQKIFNLKENLEIVKQKDNNYSHMIEKDTFSINSLILDLKNQIEINKENELKISEQSDLINQNKKYLKYLELKINEKEEVIKNKDDNIRNHLSYKNQLISLLKE